MHLAKGFHICQVYHVRYLLRSLNTVNYNNKFLKYYALNIIKYCTMGEKISVNRVIYYVHELLREDPMFLKQQFSPNLFIDSKQFQLKSQQPLFVYLNKLVLNYT